MAKHPSRPEQKWTCMCGRTFRRARKCLKCGDDLPWLVYKGEITFLRRKRMTRGEYVEWRNERQEHKELIAQAEAAYETLQGWLKDYA